MSQELWEAVDDYFAATVLPADPILGAALATSEEHGLPPYQVSSHLAMFLHLLARMCGATSILELGTLGGYSTIYLARALPENGKLITLECDPLHAEVAQQNLKRAGVDQLVELRLGDAIDSLRQMRTEGLGPFDLTFIDADKANTPAYFEAVLELSKSGSVIIVDNVVRNGAVIDHSTDDESIKGIQRFVEKLKKETRVTATMIQTVGSKGYDGFALVIVK